MKSNKNNRADMMTAIDKWKQSNLSQKEFCRKFNITHSVFYYWFAKSKKELGSFIPLGSLPVKELNTDHPYLEIITKTGACIKIFDRVSVDFIARLINR